MTEDALLAHQLLRLVRWFDHGVVQLMEAAGCDSPKRSHALVMANLDDAGATESELARRAGVSRQTIHQIVHELRNLGQLEIRAHPEDARARVVVLTPLGRSQSDVALTALRQLEAELGSRIGEEHIAGLRAALAMDPGPPPTRAPAEPALSKEASEESAQEASGSVTAPPSR